MGLRPVGLVVLGTVLATSLAVAEQGDADKSYLTWPKARAESFGLSFRKTGRIGNRMSFRGLQTNRAISFKVRATWLVPEVIRASARLAQLREGYSDPETERLVEEAEAAAGTVFLLEIDPDEGSGIVPRGFNALLYPDPAGAAVRGEVSQALYKVRALAGTQRRDYSYDLFWAAFPLAREDGEPIFASTGQSVTLVLRIEDQEERLTFTVPPSVMALSTR